MRLKISIMALAIGVIALATSCNKYLDEIPDNRTEITDANTISKILVNAYPPVTPVMAMEFMSDNYTDNGRRYTLNSNLAQQYYNFADVISEINQDSPNQYWGAYYGAIAHANIALEAIEDLGGGAEYDPQKGEALICRAYSHFMLANIFCDAYNSQFANRAYSGIPYADEVEREVHVAYERGTLEQTYQNIIRDLEEGIPLLMDSNYKQAKYHFTTAAANAFASEVYLFYAMHDDPTVREDRLRKVVEHASIAVSGNLFRDLSTFADSSDPDYMTQQWVSSEATTNLLITTAISTWGRVYPYSTRIAHNNAIQSGQTIGSAGPWGSRLAGTVGAVYVVSSLNYFFCKAMEFFTYTNVSAGIGYIRAASTPLTREKALLARAEAYALLGDYGSATADLNTWYSVWHLDEYVAVTQANIINWYRTQVNPGNQRTINAAGTDYLVNDADRLAMLYAVLHARRIETLHEGNRILDLRRYAMTYEHFWDNTENLIPTVNTQNAYFDPAVRAHDVRLTLQLPAMVLSKAPSNWANARNL